MSNLVKQYYVVQPNAKTRVINYNKQIEQKVRSISENYAKEPTVESDSIEDNTPDEGEGFVGGIVADVVSETNSSEEAQKIADDARQMAEEIIEKAKKDAENIVSNAKEQASLIFEEKRKEGYATGSEEKRLEIEQREKDLEMEISARREQLQKEYEQYSNELESDIIDAIITVFDKVFHIQFDDKKEMLLHLVKNTISKIEVGKEFRIHVSQANYKFLIAHLEEIRERIGNDIEIEIVNDAKLESSDCRIETSFGVFDCGIDMELNNLVKDIKSLCS